MREIEYLKEQKHQLEEQLDSIWHCGSPYDYVKHREDELKGQIAQIEEAIDNLESVKRTSKMIGIMMTIILALLGGLLLWAYIVKIT